MRRSSGQRHVESDHIWLVEPGGEFLEVVAAGGVGRDTAIGMRSPVGSPESESQSLSEIAFESRRPAISNDYVADPRLTRFRDRVRDLGTRSVAVIPLIKGGAPFGLLNVQSPHVGAFTPELVNLLQRLADNVSFAFANFDHADEKAQADQRIEYLATHDSLTDLPNRVMFNQLLHFAIQAGRRYERLR